MINRRKFLPLLGVIVLLGFSFSPNANATFIVGSTTSGDSWSTSLTYAVGGAFDAFDTLEAFIVFDNGAGPFDPPGLGNFSDGSWLGQVINPNYALAFGNLFPSSLSFDVLFAGNIAQLLTIDVFGWSGGVFGTLEVAAQFINTGAGLNLVCQAPGEPQSCTTFAAASQEYNRVPVPEPGTLALLGLGLVGMGLGRRKKKL